MLNSKLVRLANNASAQAIQSHLAPSVCSDDWTGTVQVRHASSLDDAQRASVWEMFKNNMFDLYVNSSFGWDPPAKRLELFDPLSRFILIYSENDTKPIAFSMFRFEREETQDVIYCYDLQVHSSMQGKGLGNKLLDMLSVLCKAYKMTKVMLTVLKANTRAFAFYQRIGFVVDETSPGYGTDEETEDEDDTEELDYEILSRAV